MKRNFYLAGAVLILIALWSRGALAAQADAWKADWEKERRSRQRRATDALRQSGFRRAFRRASRKVSEIKITGVFNRGADVGEASDGRAARRQISCRLIRQRNDDRLQCVLQSESSRSDSHHSSCFLKLPMRRSGGAASFTTSIRRTSILLNINGENRMVVAFNTKLVNPAEIKSYWDLLSPKWKGKIVAYDPTLGGSGDAMRFSITARVSDRSSSDGFSRKRTSLSAPIRVKWAIGWRVESLRSQYLGRSRAWTWT